MLTPANATLACATWQGGFVSPMRVGLSARVVIHDASTLVMRRDAIHTTAQLEATAAWLHEASRFPAGRMF
jgi:hypothetical protein